MEAAAISMCPEIRKVIQMLRAEKGCLVARMSGSGPTCFGIFQSEEAAASAEQAISARKRKDWVRATTLRGSDQAPYHGV
jgi:4-diphosphocytidyl-2-C-methyl-D-erythritol kinase